MRRPSLALALTAALLAALGAACRYDPVPQEIIDSLGEETGTPGPMHRPGQPCLACHTTYEGATPAMAVAGTIYTQNEEGGIVPAPSVVLSISQSSGGPRKACTNAAGNFYIEKEDWDDITFPLAVTAGDRTMLSLIGRDGSCGSCHKLPADPAKGGTGATFDSPGVVLVGIEATNDPSCNTVGP